MNPTPAPSPSGWRFYRLNHIFFSYIIIWTMYEKTPPFSVFYSSWEGGGSERDFAGSFIYRYVCFFLSFVNPLIYACFVYITIKVVKVSVLSIFLLSTYVHMYVFFSSISACFVYLNVKLSICMSALLCLAKYSNWENGLLKNKSIQHEDMLREMTSQYRRCKDFRKKSFFFFLICVVSASL